MKQLHHSGLPLYLDDDGVMALKPPLNYLGFGRKSAGQMAVVLPEFTEVQRDEPAYDVYRGLSFADDQERLAADQYQYDITIIMPGTIGHERKKTSGHYHGYNDTRRNTHPEVYEVIKGTAAYILQKSPDFAVAPKDLVVDDLIVAVVKEGQSIIVPPNYGHSSINIGDGRWCSATWRINPARFTTTRCSFTTVWPATSWRRTAALRAQESLLPAYSAHQIRYRQREPASWHHLRYATLPTLSRRTGTFPLSGACR